MLQFSNAQRTSSLFIYFPRRLIFRSHEGTGGIQKLRNEEDGNCFLSALSLVSVALLFKTKKSTPARKPSSYVGILLRTSGNK